jgi:cytochrome oxidase Cu insertion factor (SCO1/SenC/PrrC family)
MRDSLLALGLGALFLATPVVWAKPDFASMQVTPYNPPKPAPSLALPDLQGKTIRLTDFTGKVVLVFFWATW